MATSFHINKIQINDFKKSSIEQNVKSNLIQ